MTVKLVGYQSMGFTDDKTGEFIQGTNLFYLHNDMEVTGMVAAKKFVKRGVQLPELICGRDYIMDFSPKGKLIDFSICPEHPSK